MITVVNINLETNASKRVSQKQTTSKFLPNSFFYDITPPEIHKDPICLGCEIDMASLLGTRHDTVNRANSLCKQRN